MGDSDFNITSELFLIKTHFHRRERFYAQLQSRYCAENYEVWERIADIIDLIRNNALEVERQRNSRLFDLFNLYLHDDAETPIQCSVHLKKKLQEMISNLRSSPDAKFDVRVILELQKEVEVLLVADVKGYCLEFPSEEEEPQQKRGTLESVLTVSIKLTPGKSMGKSVGSTSSLRKGASIRKGMFGGSNSPTEMKLRVCLEDAQISMYAVPASLASMGSSSSIGSVAGQSSPNVNTLRTENSSGVINNNNNNNNNSSSAPPAKSEPMYLLPVASVVMEQSQPAPASLKKSSKGAPPEITLTSTLHANNQFVLRFRSEEEKEQWVSVLQEQIQRAAQVKAARKQQRTNILQAEIGMELQWSSGQSASNFQGVLLRRGESRKLVDISATSLTPRQTASLADKGDGWKRAIAPSPGLSRNATVATIVRQNTPKSLSDSNAGSRGFLTVSAAATLASRSPSASHSDEEESEEEDIVAHDGMRGVYRHVMSFDTAPGLADASMYGVADDSPMASMLKAEKGRDSPLLTDNSSPSKSSSGQLTPPSAGSVGRNQPPVLLRKQDNNERRRSLGGELVYNTYDTPDRQSKEDVRRAKYKSGGNVLLMNRQSALSDSVSSESDGNPLANMYSVITEGGTSGSSASVVSPRETSPAELQYATASLDEAAAGKPVVPVPVPMSGKPRPIAPIPMSGVGGSGGGGGGVGSGAGRAPPQLTSMGSAPVLLELSESSSEVENEETQENSMHRDNLYDFNAIFQEKLAQLRSLQAAGENSMNYKDKLEALYSSIIRLGEDFVKTALTYGKIIINEKYLPYKHKTIKPSSDLGGVLGGEKYVVHNMLFKFAIDSKGVFRGRDDLSAKVAGLELKGLKAYFSVSDTDLHFPLMALIDYKGFRLIAVSLLPLKRDSLIYGSNDAGANVHAKDSRLNLLIENASKQLNLKPHTCGTDRVTVYSPVDLEGHIGEDGRYYLLDFSRVFPPVAPSKEVPGGHLYQMFRAEFLYNWPLFPLCSDGFSRFVQGQPDEKEHQQEIEAATKDLTGITLSNFARELATTLEQEVRLVGTLSKFHLTEEMHRIGLNMRYLGQLVPRLGKFKLSKFLVAHMCARIIKAQIRARLRNKMAELKLAVDEPYRICVTDYLNLVFGDSSASTEHWNKDIVSGLDKTFTLRPNNWRGFPKNLKEYIWSGLEIRKGLIEDLRIYLFDQVRQMTGISFSSALESLVRSSVNNSEFWTQKKFCDDTDVVDLGAKVKHLDVMSKARGNVFTMRATEKQQQGYVSSARQLYQSALESFETALSGSPLDSYLLRDCAITLLRIVLIDERMLDPEQVDREVVLPEEHPAVVKAGRYFVRSIQANPDDQMTHLSYAKFLVLIRSFEKAEDHFLEALSLDPNSEKSLLAYSQFLKSVRGLTMESQMFRSRAFQVRKFMCSKLGFANNAEQPTGSLTESLIIPHKDVVKASPQLK